MLSVHKAPVLIPCTKKSKLYVDMYSGLRTLQAWAHTFAGLSMQILCTGTLLLSLCRPTLCFPLTPLMTRPTLCGVLPHSALSPVHTRTGKLCSVVCQRIFAFSVWMTINMLRKCQQNSVSLACHDLMNYSGMSMFFITSSQTICLIIPECCRVALSLHAKSWIFLILKIRTFCSLWLRSPSSLL